MVKNFTDENFQTEVIEASKIKPVLVDFFADWCGPCKVMSTIIDEMAEEIGDKAIIGKLDTQESTNTSEKYDIMGLPTFIIFKDGEAVETLSGLQAKEALIELLEKHIK